MKRITGRLATMVCAGAAACLCAAGGAWASDIACNSPAGESTVRCNNPDGSGVRCTLATDEPRPRARHALICNSSRLSERYERIYAEQQRMLRKGRIDNADITAWRARRDACESARCLEGLFARFWRERDSMKSASGAPASTSTPPTAKVQTSPTIQAPAAALPSPALAAVPDGTPATALPAPQAVQEPEQEPVALTQPLAAAAPAPADPGAESLPYIETFNSSPARSYPAALTAESVLSGLAVLGMGAGFLWTRRAAGAGHGWRRGVPAAIAIVFSLLLVNALLLPFTLAL